MFSLLFSSEYILQQLWKEAHRFRYWCSEVHVVDSNSGAMVDQSSSDPPNDVDESVMNIAEKIAEVELDKKGDS